MDGLRNFRRSDIDSLVELAIECETADGHESPPTREQIEHQLSFPGIDIQNCLYVLQNPAGQLKALCGAIPLPERDGVRVQVILIVHPDHRHESLGRDLIRFVEDLAVETPRNSGQAVRLTAGAPDRQPYYLELFKAGGFQIDRYFLELARDLTQPIPDSPVPDGVILRTINVDQDIAAYHKAFDESFQDHYNPVLLTLEQAQHMVTSPGFRPNLTLLAFGPNGDPAGVYASRARARYNQLNGTSEGVVDILGVRRPYRTLGLGRVLLTRGLQLLRADGMTVAMLQVDAESPTGATRLYDWAGFVERKRSMVMSKSLPVPR